MKTVAIIIALACFGQNALAVDEPTPSPTPVYRNRLARPGSQRRQEQLERRRALQSKAESAPTRAKTKSDRRSSASSQAQARAAARAREQAQRQVAAQARHETAKATPHATSDLMNRMGFSEEEIAAQRAREQPVKAGAKETNGAQPEAERPQEPPKPAADTGDASDHPTLSHAKANDAATPREQHGDQPTP